MVRHPRQDRDGLVAFPFDRVLGGMDALGGVVERRLGLRAPRLVFGGGVGQLLPLGVESFFFASEELEALPQQADLVLVLHLPRGDRLALALRELHLLFRETQLLVDAVRSIGQLLHVVLVLEELEPLRRQARFQPRDLGVHDFLRVGRVRKLARERAFLLLRRQPLPAGSEQLQLPQLAAQLAELLRLLRLPLETLQAAAHLADHVGEPQQVLLGGLQLALGLLSACLVLGDSGRLFDDRAPVLRLRADDETDAALLDDGVRARPDARAEEQLGDVEQPAGGLVDLVFARAVAEQAARHGDVGESRVLRRHEAAVVLEGDRHLGHAGGRTRLAAAEDDVFHRAAAQMLRALLAHRPADGVDDVALAAAVRSHHSGDAVVEGKDDAVRERLEAGNLDPPAFHLARD